MSTAVESAPVVAAASNVETAYAEFGKSGRPMTALCIFIAAMALLTIAVASLHDPKTSFSVEPPWFTWIAVHNEEICFTAPAIIAACRGRRYLKSILLGKLTPLATIWVGVGTGFGCVALSTLLYVDFKGWPSFDGSGFVRAFGLFPLTAYLLGPFGEEMFFQVGLQTWLQRYGPIAAVLGASAPFWGTHLYGGFVPMHDALMFLLPAILSYTLVRQTTKSFGASVLAHSTYNVLISCLAFTPRS